MPAGSRGIYLESMTGQPNKGIDCGSCRGRHATVDQVHVCHSEPEIENIDKVSRLLQENAPAFSDLLDAMAAYRGTRGEELLDRCLQIALASITGEVPKHHWKPVVRGAASRLIGCAKRERLETDVRAAANQLRSAKEDKTEKVAKVIEEEAAMLDEITVLLSNGEPPNLVSFSSRLRKLARPDLAVVVATEAVDADTATGPARTTRAAAYLDMSKWDDAIEDLGGVEVNEPSSYSANAWSRAANLTGDHDEAMRWAEKHTSAIPMESPECSR